MHRGYIFSNLKDIRESIGLSQRQLSAYSGVSQRTISNIEVEQNLLIRGTTFYKLLSALRKLDANVSDAKVKKV